MNDGIRFDTSTMRGFAEWLHNQTDGEGGYVSKIDTILAKLGGSGMADHQGGGYDAEADAANAQSIGTSGIAYYGKDYGAAEVKNAQAAVKYLGAMKRSLLDMADAAGVAAEDFTGQDGENAEDLDKNFDASERQY